MMRAGMGLGGIVLVWGLAGPVLAQSSDPVSFLTGVSPQNMVNQRVDISQSLAPPPQTTDGFSIRRLLNKAFPFLVSAPTPSINQFSPSGVAGFSPPPNISSFSPLAFFGLKAQSQAQVPRPLPAPTAPAATPVVMPLFKPTTGLPPIINSPIQPVLPPASLPPFQLTGPIQPVPPLVPNN
jgi:hypothetical protein